MATARSQSNSVIDPDTSITNQRLADVERKILEQKRQDLAREMEVSRQLIAEFTSMKRELEALRGRVEVALHPQLDTHDLSSSDDTTMTTLSLREALHAILKYSG